MKSKISKTHNVWWKPIVHFAGHSLSGALIILALAAPAVGLNLTIAWLETLHISSLITMVFTLLEDVVLFVDALLFVVYLVVTAKRAVTEIIEDESGPK